MTIPKIKLTAEVIEGFVGSVLANRYDSATAIPEFHKELWQLACSDNKFVAIAAPRGHAKSTAGTIAYTLASILFRSANYVVLVSDTESQAVMFLLAIKQELQENQDIKDFFHLTTDEKGVKFEKDTEAVITGSFKDGHKFRIIAKGSESSLRGLLWNGQRPDLIVIDDFENDELVMSKDRREKLKRWFYGALLPSLKPSGKVRMWGTILHNSSLLESLMPSLTAKNTRYSGLKMYSEPMPFFRPMFKSLRYRAHSDDYKEILWSDRFDADFYKTKKAEFDKQGLSDVYAQEYLNLPIDASKAYYRKFDMHPMQAEDKKSRKKYYVTADLAISQDERADYSVFMVVGMDEARNVHVVNVYRDRMDSLEIIDTIFMLQKIYQPEAIGIEKMQVTQAIAPILREEMVKRGVFPNIYEISHMNKDKPTRGRSMQARLRAQTVRFDKDAEWWPALEEELSQFPRGKNDDQADAFAYAGLLLDKMTEAQTDREIREEDTEEALYELGLPTRNPITGY